MQFFWLCCIWISVLSCAGFVAMGVDKLLAKNGARRISEKTLLMLSLAGGAVGAWAGMRMFHHKTKHRVFFMGLPAMAVAHGIALLAILWLLQR